MGNSNLLKDVVKYRVIAQEHMMPRNGVFCILYCDNYGKYDYDMKIAMTMRWNNLKGFLGGKVDGNETLKEALQREVMEEGNFDITGKEVEWLSSYADGNFGIHCYTCKITPEEMKSLRENFTKGSHAEEEVAGLLVLNLKEGELNENLLNSGFEASSRLELIHFMNKLYKRDTVMATLALHRYGMLDNSHMDAYKALLCAEAKEVEFDDVFSKENINKYLKDVSDISDKEVLNIFELVEESANVRVIASMMKTGHVGVFFIGKGKVQPYASFIVKDLAVLKMAVKAGVYSSEFGPGFRNLTKVFPTTAFWVGL